MVKVKVTEEFTLGKFNEIKNIERANYNKKEIGRLYVNDTFECNEEMAEYLMEKNPLNRAFVKIIEVIPEKKEKKENTEKKIITRRRKRSVAKD